MKRIIDRVISSTLILLAAVSVFLCAHAYGFNKCDFNGSGRVSLEDFSILAASWGVSLDWGPDGKPDQMISHWRLDQNAVDSQSGFDGIVHGSPEWVTGPFKIVGSGAIFMDGEDYIQIDASEYPEISGSITIDVWVKTDGSVHDQVIISKGRSNWQLGIEADTNKAFFSCSGLLETPYLASTTPLSNGQWHRLSAVYNQTAQEILLYIDGTLDTQADASGSINANQTDIWIGGDPEQTSPANWFYGYIDNVRVFNHAAGHDQIFNSKVIQVDINSSSSKNDGASRQSAYRSIQEAINAAEGGDKIHVWPGVYTEAIDFKGKAIIVKSIADAAVIRAPDDYAVSFYFAEQSDSVLENFIIKDSEVAISVSNSSPTLRNLTIVGNDYGIDLWGSSHPEISNCIFWDNEDDDIYWEAFAPNITYSCIQRPFSGQGNISLNPQFADAVSGDFHLKSKLGRYMPDHSNPRNPKPENWVIDNVYSPCIDAGKPKTNPMNETMPNGGRINMGSYGSTAFASKSPWPLQADLNYNGHVWYEDLIKFAQNWLLAGTE